MADVSVWDGLIVDAVKLGVAALVGATTGLLTSSLTERGKRDHERKSLGYALAAEMEEGIAMTERRQYAQLYQSLLAHLKAGRNVQMPKDLVDAEVDPIFTANMSKIGILGPDVAAKIVKYHSLSVGIRKDMVTLSDLPKPATPADEAFQIGIKIKLIEEDLGLWEEGKRVANDVIKAIRAE